MNKELNPLTQFYRTATTSVKLPSRGKYYEDGVLNLNDDGEVSIFPMTAQDEITLKNPDALLSGEAVIKVIKSCVPDILKPKKLLSSDIDVLMIAVRVASYGDDATMDTECPKCKEDNTFTLNLDTLLNHTETLDDSYEVVLNSNLTVFLAPGKFEGLVKQQKAAFQNTKLEQAIINPDLTDEQRMKILSKVFEQVSKFNYELVLEAITKVVFTNEEGLQEVTDRSQIGEWINNIQKGDTDKLQAKIAEINKIGIEKTLSATCDKCEHTWDASIEFNPVNFS